MSFTHTNMNEPKLYQIIRGPDLTSSQVQAVLEEFPLKNSQWAYQRSFYFNLHGKKFLGIWRDL